MDILPFIVKYKAGTDKSIKPGIHGRFETEEQAKNAAKKCQTFFGGPKRVIVGIVVDPAMLAMQNAQHEGVDPVEPDSDMSPLEQMRIENALLRKQLGMAVEDEECEAQYDTSENTTQKPEKAKRSPVAASTESP